MGISGSRALKMRNVNDGARGAVKKKEKERGRERGAHLRCLRIIVIQSTKAGGKIKMECIFETLSFNNHITILVIFTINIHYSYLYVANVT